MKRLRHPVRAIREPFGTAGLIVACIALVLALTGAAFAAGALTGKQKKEVEKIAKKFAGKPGAAGAQGPAGPQGPAGAAGKNGSNGSNGTNGAAGPTGPTGPKGAAGSAGAVGETGPTGATGPTGSFGGQPTEPGVTLTGRWVASGNVQTLEIEKEGTPETISVGDPSAYAAISLPQPVAIGSSVEVHFQTEENFKDFDGAGEGTVGCTGSFAAPTAPPGALCIYTSLNPAGFKNMSFEGSGPPPLFGGEFNRYGTTLKFLVKGPEALAIGSWAVTSD